MSARRLQLIHQGHDLFNPHTPAYRAEIQSKWNAAIVNRHQVDVDTDMVLKFKPLYLPVQAQTGVPWWMVGIFDMREESFRHDKNLVNGDPLNRITTHVPKGIGPFTGPDAWSKAAVFAMHYSRLAVKDLIGAIIEMERYNGEGYHSHQNPAAPSTPEPSPYIWSGTTIYVRGKYRADGVWDPHLIDQQSGGCAIMKSLLKRGIDLGLPLALA
jgi:lysozyme family protein